MRWWCSARRAARRSTWEPGWSASRRCRCPCIPELKLALPRPAVSEAIDGFQPDLIHVVNPAVLGLGGIWLAKNQGTFPWWRAITPTCPSTSSITAWACSNRLLWELLKAAHNQALLNLCTSTAMVQELSDKGIQNTDRSGSEVSIPSCSDPNCAAQNCRQRLSGCPRRPGGSCFSTSVDLSAEKADRTDPTGAGSSARCPLRPGR